MWILVSTQLSNNGDDAIVVCIQRVYANSKWVGGCTYARGLADRSGPRCTADACHSNSRSLILRGYSVSTCVTSIHASSLVMDDVLWLR